MSRVQLALNVSDLEASVDFYSRLFATQPHKRRPGSANFAIADPPLKLVLIEVPDSERGTGTEGALNHLGVEVADTVAVAAHSERLRDEGMATAEEIDTTCCFALQDKVWVHDPAGAPWEVYTVKDDNPVMTDGPAVLPVDDAACCTPEVPHVLVAEVAPAGS
jgi:catechol 2,3-dioxygenase-like lactoylglutathione lyase family enzyme